MLLPTGRKWSAKLDHWPQLIEVDDEHFGFSPWDKVVLPLAPSGVLMHTIA
jgi:hypothetical protein